MCYNHAITLQCFDLRVCRLCRKLLNRRRRRSIMEQRTRSPDDSHSRMIRQESSVFPKREPVLCTYANSAQLVWHTCGSFYCWMPSNCPSVCLQSLLIVSPTFTAHTNALEVRAQHACSLHLRLAAPTDMGSTWKNILYACGKIPPLYAGIPLPNLYLGVHKMR